MKQVIFFFLLLAGRAVFSQPAPETKPNYILVEKAHGLGPDQKPVPDNYKDSASSKSPQYEFKVIKTTDSVPAKINTVFGIEFTLKGKDTSDVHYTAEWVYPSPMKEPDGTLYGGFRGDYVMWMTKENTVSFTLSKTYELIKGKWKLNIYLEGKKAYSRTFIMY